MLSVAQLPHLNAALNALCAVLLFTGWLFIRKGNRRAHGRVMAAAFTVSCLFLVSYLIYHYHVGSVRFPDLGFIRVVYLAILLTHIVLAVPTALFAVVAVVHAVRGRFDKHTKITRWLIWVWLYVSVTGVVVYLMLYHLFAPA